MGVRGSTFATPFATSFTTFIPIREIFGGCLGLLAFCILSLEFITLAFLYVTFVFVVTTFAAIATGDGTPDMILMGPRFPILGMLLSFHLQHTATAVIAVRGMTSPPLVIDRFAVEQRGRKFYSYFNTVCLLCLSCCLLLV